MKALVAVAACLCLGAADPPLPPDAPPGSSYVSSAWPPSQYQKDGAAVVIFTSDVGAYCGRASPPLTIIACSTAKDGTPIIIMPNPNLAPKDDFYAHIMAHELGHSEGWPAWHPPGPGQ